jgi:glycosyltransferase involved in cell wall biosynthesis
MPDKFNPKSPAVSILIPVYKTAPFIERCTHSLFRQSFDNVEFVFVDDASPDDSTALIEALLELYPERKKQVKIIRHAENKGIGATRNTLLDNADGEYLLWVDSDDFIDEDSVRLLYIKAAETKADLITTDCYYSVTGHDRILKIKQYFPDTPATYIEALAFRNVRAALWGTLSKRSLWTDNGIRMADGVNFGEDYYTTVRLTFFARKMTILHQPVYYYNQMNTSAYSSGAKRGLHFESIIGLFDHLEKFFISNNVLPRYQSFLDKARLMERSACLLHTTASLRRKYAGLYAEEAKRFPESELPLSAWQLFILRLITSRNFVLADMTVIIAKVLRKFFGISF